MSSEKIRNLTNTLSLTQRQRKTLDRFSPNRTKAHSQKDKAKFNYELFTNHSKQEQKAAVKQLISARTTPWKYDYYRINKTFSLYPSEQIDPFPHNNRKYNIQFLDRSLHGQSLKFPAKDWGLFPAPKDKLYSRHYRPIVKDKRKYNEDYELRASLFGDTWVDLKHRRIMNHYRTGANPFRTPASNTFITTMRKDSHNYHQI